MCNRLFFILSFLSNFCSPVQSYRRKAFDFSISFFLKKDHWNQCVSNDIWRGCFEYQSYHHIIVFSRYIKMKNKLYQSFTVNWFTNLHSRAESTIVLSGITLSLSAYHVDELEHRQNFIRA